MSPKSNRRTSPPAHDRGASGGLLCLLFAANYQAKTGIPIRCPRPSDAPILPRNCGNFSGGVSRHCVLRRNALRRALGSGVGNAGRGRADEDDARAPMSAGPARVAARCRRSSLGGGAAPDRGAGRQTRPGERARGAQLDRGGCRIRCRKVSNFNPCDGELKCSSKARRSS